MGWGRLVGAVAVGVPAIYIGLTMSSQTFDAANTQRDLGTLYAVDAAQVSGVPYVDAIKRVHNVPLSKKDIDSVLKRPIPAKEDEKANRINADVLLAAHADASASDAQAYGLVYHGMAAFGATLIVGGALDFEKNRRQ